MGFFSFASFMKFMKYSFNNIKIFELKQLSTGIYVNTHHNSRETVPFTRKSFPRLTRVTLIEGLCLASSSNKVDVKKSHLKQ